MRSKAKGKSIHTLLAELAAKDGIKGLYRLPGLWERRIDEHWEIAVNGHKKTLEWKQAKNRMGCKVQPFCCAVMFNGWLAGLLYPYGGTMAAGKLANEQTFIAALERALEDK